MRQVSTHQESLDQYSQLGARRKAKPQAVTAVGRELLGFIWAIGVHVESQREGQQAKRQYNGRGSPEP